MDRENATTSTGDQQKAFTQDPGALLSPSEIAEECRVGRSTVYDWLKSGKLRGKRLGGGVWRVTRRALDQFKGTGEGDLFEPAQTEDRGE